MPLGPTQPSQLTTPTHQTSPAFAQYAIPAAVIIDNTPVYGSSCHSVIDADFRRILQSVTRNYPPLATLHTDSREGSSYAMRRSCSETSLVLSRHARLSSLFETENDLHPPTSLTVFSPSVGPLGLMHVSRKPHRHSALVARSSTCVFISSDQDFIYTTDGSSDGTQSPVSNSSRSQSTSDSSLATPSLTSHLVEFTEFQLTVSDNELLIHTDITSVLELAYTEYNTILLEEAPILLVADAFDEEMDWDSIRDDEDFANNEDSNLSCNGNDDNIPYAAEPDDNHPSSQNDVEVTHISPSANASPGRVILNQLIYTAPSWVDLDEEDDDDFFANPPVFFDDPIAPTSNIEVSPVILDTATVDAIINTENIDATTTFEDETEEMLSEWEEGFEQFPRTIPRATRLQNFNQTVVYDGGMLFRYTLVTQAYLIEPEMWDYLHPTGYSKNAEFPSDLYDI